MTLPRYAPIMAIALLSASYYALYADFGFNIADDGNYAQMAYEFYLGRSPSDLAVNYGLLWFQIGAALFRVFGVDYDLVKWTFFTAIILTNVLVYVAICDLTGRRSLAAFCAAVTALAPSFPATAFYGLCVLLNVAAQARMVRHWEAPDWRPAAMAGVALALSFQLRPDFGYAFIVPLLAIAALRKSRWRQDLTAALGGFLATMSPAAFAAAVGGYGEQLTALFLSYPAMMVEYVAVGISAALGLSASGTNMVEATNFLQRPSIAELFGGEQQAFAWLIYLPVIGITALAALTIYQFRTEWSDNRRRISVKFVALSAAAAFPHYFLFRPDMAHLANFMPGYVVLAAVLISLLRARSDVLWRLGAVAAGLHVIFYGVIGVQSPVSGAIGTMAGRSERFQAENGVDVWLNGGELALYSELRDIVTANSKQGDAIVCLPYCPGVAFMTGRRLLHANFYADESFLTRNPDWLPNAMAEVREKRPPVVIVTEWAINGTEFSKLKNWASPYVNTLDDIAAQKIERADLSIYIIERETAAAN